MEHLPALIQDLAWILLVAAGVSLLFKWLKQPVVLGYIVAGFIAGPHFVYTPSVRDVGSIDIWAQIGVVILLFTLGLEFSFKKILKMGAAPVIAALTIIFCMMFLGTSVGHLFGVEEHGLHLSGRNVGHVFHYHYIQGFSGSGCFTEKSSRESCSVY